MLNNAGQDISDRPILSIPVSRAEKRIYALYWLALALSLTVAVLAVVYLPDRPVVQPASGSGPDVVRDKYALVAFSFLVLCVAPMIALLPRYPLHRSTYFVKITPENAEAQYKLGRYASACLFTSIAWWFAAAQAVSLVVWLSSRDNPVLMNGVLMPMTLLPVGAIVFGVVASRRLG
jgi:hypothetical protein